MFTSPCCCCSCCWCWKFRVVENRLQGKREKEKKERTKIRSWRKKGRIICCLASVMTFWLCKFLKEKITRYFSPSLPTPLPSFLPSFLCQPSLPRPYLYSPLQPTLTYRQLTTTSAATRHYELVPLNDNTQKSLYSLSVRVCVSATLNKLKHKTQTQAQTQTLPPLSPFLYFWLRTKKYWSTFLSFTNPFCSMNVGLV